MRSPLVTHCQNCGIDLGDASLPRQGDTLVVCRKCFDSTSDRLSAGSVAALEERRNREIAARQASEGGR